MPKYIVDLVEGSYGISRTCIVADYWETAEDGSARFYVADTDPAAEGDDKCIACYRSGWYKSVSLVPEETTQPADEAPLACNNACGKQSCSATTSPVHIQAEQTEPSQGSDTAPQTEKPTPFDVYKHAVKLSNLHPIVRKIEPQVNAMSWVDRDEATKYAFGERESGVYVCEITSTTEDDRFGNPLQDVVVANYSKYNGTSNWSSCWGCGFSIGSHPLVEKGCHIEVVKELSADWVAFV